MDESTLSKELSKLLLIYRTKNKITLEKLSELVQLDSKFLNKLEKGHHTTLLTNYFKIAKALAVPLYEIDKLIKEYMNS